MAAFALTSVAPPPDATPAGPPAKISDAERVAVALSQRVHKVHYGPVDGFKLHAWATLNGKIARYEIQPANEHDFTVGCMMNRD